MSMGLWGKCKKMAPKRGIRVKNKYRYPCTSLFFTLPQLDMLWIINLKSEAKNDYYQSEKFVCVCNLQAFANTLVDAVDQLLI